MDVMKVHVFENHSDAYQATLAILKLNDNRTASVKMITYHEYVVIIRDKHTYQILGMVK